MDIKQHLLSGSQAMYEVAIGIVTVSADLPGADQIAAVEAEATRQAEVQAQREKNWLEAADVLVAKRKSESDPSPLELPGKLEPDPGNPV
jgi:uncharacterized membrane protein